MKFFSDCSGECKDCYTSYVGGCLAGHGDDGFTQITEKEAIRIIKKGWVKYESDIKVLFKMFPDIERKLKLDKISEIKR
jgi:hypothetical protein